MTLKLTKGLKAKIVERFKAGEGIHTVALWYGKSPAVIEGVIREAMLEPLPKNNGVPTHQEVTEFVEQL